MEEPRGGSETGVLKKAVVHAPGGELSNLSPSNRREFGFNDLLYERHARREHETLVSLLRDVWGVEVLFFGELLEEALGRANSMDRLRLLQTVAEVEELAPRERERLLGLGVAGAGEVARRLVVGDPVRPDHSVGEFLSPELYHLPPLPNLMLVRDLAATVGDRMLVAWSSMRVRRRENLLWRFILQHSGLKESVRWSSWMVEDERLPEHPSYSLDGGNVLQPGEGVVVVGQGARTGRAAVERLAAWLGENAKRETHLFIARLPGSVEHLDTVFTMLGPDECLVYPPAVLGNGPESINVLHVVFRPGEVPRLDRPRELLGPLGEALGVELRPVSCGGEGALEQRREQWWGGACVLAVAPGKLVAFRSTGRTVEELGRRGYECLEAGAVLSGKGDPHAHEKCVVLINGAELSRARGGPRSFVLPLVRD